VELHSEVGLDWNVYSAQAQAASSLFKPVHSVHCLRALDLRAGVEQPTDCFIIQNCQAVQSMGRLMDWTSEDNMINGLIFCATSHKLQKRHLCKWVQKRPTPVRRQLSWTHTVSGTTRNFVQGGSVTWCTPYCSFHLFLYNWKLVWSTSKNLSKFVSGEAMASSVLF